MGALHLGTGSRAFPRNPGGDIVARWCLALAPHNSECTALELRSPPSAKPPESIRIPVLFHHETKYCLRLSSQRRVPPRGRISADGVIHRLVPSG